METKPRTATPAKRATAHLTGLVTQILTHVDGMWAEIFLDGADNFYREIRVRHLLENEDGTVTRLNVGDRVSVFVRLEK